MKPRQRSFVSAWLTAAFLLLVAGASSETLTWFQLVIVLVISSAAFALYRLFPQSGSFAMVFANCLAVYACLYSFFAEVNFKQSGDLAHVLSFPLPILGYLIGAYRQRKAIARALEEAQPPATSDLGPGLLWLAPLAFIGAATFWMPEVEEPGLLVDLLLGASMAVIGAITAVFSFRISLFLQDASQLFDDLFRRLRILVLPIFAFFTLYSLIVIVFASLYRVFDAFTPAPNFSINGVEQSLTFAESLYFSIVTLSTLGFGDIVPLTPGLRILVVIETLCGVLLLLFGFAEIMRQPGFRRGKGRSIGEQEGDG